MRWIAAILTMMMLGCTPALAADSNDIGDLLGWANGLTASVAGDADLDAVRGRVGYTWVGYEAGVTGTWFVEDEAGQTDGDRWGIGAYGKYIIEPDASIPVADWLPRVGSWLHLPDSLHAQTYLVADSQLIQVDDATDLAMSVGAGIQASIGYIEWTYGIIESGESDDPVLSSGATLWLGLCVGF